MPKPVIDTPQSAIWRARVAAQARHIARWQAYNDTFRPCPHCRLPVSPEGRQRHIRICHDRD